MVYCCIYSVFYYFGLIVSYLNLHSHQASHRLCGFIVHPLLDLSVWVCIFRRVRKYHRPSVSRYLPTVPRHPHHRRLLRCRYSLLSGFGRSSVFRLQCHGLSCPSVRSFRLGSHHYCLFFGFISPLVLIAGFLLRLRSLWTNGLEIIFRFFSGISFHGTFGPAVYFILKFTF